MISSEWYKPIKGKKLMELTKNVTDKKQQIKQYVDNYKTTHNRNPTIEETKKYFTGTIDSAI